MILTILVLILVIFFIGGAILRWFGNAVSDTIGISIFAGIPIFKKLKQFIHRKREREVNVSCPCSYEFLAIPKRKEDWIVICAKCGRKLRVNTSKKKK